MKKDGEKMKNKNSGKRIFLRVISFFNVTVSLIAQLLLLCFAILILVFGNKLAEGDFCLRLGVQGVEQLLMLELEGCQKCSNASAKRRKGRLNWQQVNYLPLAQDGKQARKGK